MDSASPAPPRRGRPPSQAARRAILKAARALLEEGGVLAVTMEGIAARAKVGKPTVYRHWSNRYEVTMAALMDAASEAEAPALPDAPLEALRQQLLGLAGLFTSATGRNVAAMLVSGYGETALSKAFRIHFVQARRDEGRQLLSAATARGELRADLDLEVALDLIYGAVFYRLMMAHAPIDAGFVDALLKNALAGLAA